MMLVLWLVASIFLIFAAAVFFGSPYLRTHRQCIEVALDLLELKPGDTLLDLGSGDGAVLIAASKRGIRSIGYEINPILWFVTWLRIRRYGGLAKVNLGSMWRAKITPDVNGVFIFLDSRFLERLDVLMRASGLPLRLTSYSYLIPDKEPVKSVKGVHLYEYPN